MIFFNKSTLANTVLFHESHAYVTQLIEVFEQIGRKLDNSKQIDVIYLDMSKAFDKVTITLIIVATNITMKANLKMM
jgi:hypothetical protein